MNKKEIKELQKQMTFDENGEGIINGKTIREHEAENLKKLVENQQNNVSTSIYKYMFKKKRRSYKNKYRYKERKVTLF